MAVNLENLSSRELEELIVAAAEQKKKLQKQRLSEVRGKLIEMAREEGYTIEELFGTGRGKAGRTVAPKYRNPDDPAQTWTGRGKRPRWVQAQLDAGKSLESLEI
ncbi:H-NS family nucleoid-associated regulatory protein [Pseudomarimonas salicorniae]|uniref:H-NS histone family protein n=1 Tax=Pseudomarimonas salicorniae TaxID=2933270 RepID=A0ABT0GHJ4_9GAMM|nr:H-NS histone family protein [Lysobacter sp. CAU 1642]MCK7594020.1 H-NS histone family protein [Lysobacter sp. CAU 1642]